MSETAGCVLCAVMRPSALAVALVVFTVGCGSNESTTTDTIDPTTFDAMWNGWSALAPAERAALCTTYDIAPEQTIERAVADGPDGMNPAGVARFLDAWCEPVGD